MEAQVAAVLLDTLMFVNWAERLAFSIRVQCHPLLCKSGVGLQKLQLLSGVLSFFSSRLPPDLLVNSLVVWMSH